MERIGYGKAINYEDLTEENLLQAIREVLDNPEYAEAARRYGELLLDQENPPLDRAVWWLEFLLRHKGTNHFRSPVHEQAWHQYFLLDVLLVLFLAFALVAWLLGEIIWRFLVWCRTARSFPDSSKKTR